MDSGKHRSKRKDYEPKVESRLEVVKSDGETESETCMTFVLHDEDHTLGNSLRYIVMKNPDVLFCGYNTPHPSENKINFRIQTSGTPAVSVLRKGLKDLNQLSNHVLNTFQRAVIKFKNADTGDANMDSDSEGVESD